MHDESVKNLEFEIILNQVSNNCNSEISKSSLKNSEIIYDRSELQKVMHEISETKEIYQAESGLPIWTFDDVRELLHKIEPIGSYLEVAECQKIQNFLEIVLELKKFFKKYPERFLNLQDIAKQLYEVNTLYSLIKNTIDPSGNIFDNASKDLKNIRNDIEYQHKQIHIILERILRKKKEHLQEEYITLREGRLVLPVREFSVNKIPGIIHGQSQTGQTQYIEPLEAVNLNNHLNDLYRLEKIEIIKILKRISDNIRENSLQLTENFNKIVYFDILQSKARYALKANATAPEISEDFFWDIKHGYHPILLSKLGPTTVPLNVQIGQQFRSLIISGPNAGGKTVALKTMGLLQLMFQSGFHIPVGEGSKFPLCKCIFAVIGDEQSIENDLSTFSSHIRNINNILNNIKPDSLVLIDEIGSGTDPAEGSALAIAILDNLNKPEIVTIATTHQSALKEFAFNTDFIQNAAMQFDIKSLKPLFVLDVGIPGSSYAFEISQRLGMDKKIIASARRRIGNDTNELDRLLIELTKEKQKYQKLVEDLSIKKTELDGLKNVYQQRADDLKKNKNKYEKEAKEKALDLLQNVNKTVENVVAEIKESNAEPKIIKSSKKTINNLKGKFKSEEVAKGIDLKDIKVGQIVKSIKFDLVGEVQSINHAKKEVEITSKGVKFKVSLEDLTTTSEKVKQDSDSATVRPVIKQVENELDLRGMQSDDALMELEKYLELAQHSGWNTIRIIHGKGTGALRKSIHQFLKKKSLVKSFNLAKYGDGDTGVTILNM